MTSVTESFRSLSTQFGAAGSQGAVTRTRFPGGADGEFVIATTV